MAHIETSNVSEAVTEKVTSVTELLAMIQQAEAALTAMKAKLGVEGVTLAPAKGGKAKKVKDPNAPKKPANDFIKFTSRVWELFKSSLAAAKEAGDEERVKHLTHPVTVNKQFCSWLKDQRTTTVEKDGKSVTVPDYSAWEDAEILQAFDSWTPPEVSKMEAEGKTKKQKKAEAESASESGSVAESAPKERKKRAPLTEEQKAERKRKMAEKKAAKAVAEKASEGESSDSEEEAEKPAPPAPKPVEAPKPAEKKGAFKPKAVAKKAEFTMDQLKEFEEFEFNGETYGRNARGDVLNSDFEWVGRWNGKTIDTKVAEPSDLPAIKAELGL